MKRFFKKLFEKIIEGILFLSSTVTSLAIVLIVIFLFREGISLFGNSPVEEGFVIAANSKNPVTELKSSQIKDIFDGHITSWKELGGKCRRHNVVPHR
jgi:phosphate transport system permease protein